MESQDQLKVTPTQPESPAEPKQTVKIPYKQIRAFLDDPMRIGSNPDQDWKGLNECFNKMSPKLAKIVSDHETPIREAYTKAIEKGREDFCTAVFEQPYTDQNGRPATSFQFQYTYQGSVEMGKLTKKAGEEVKAKFDKLKELEVEIEPEICSFMYLPPFQKFTLKDRELGKYDAYYGIILAPKVKDEGKESEPSKEDPKEEKTQMKVE